MRAHDVAHGINLEKAGATAVIPEILEPSLQLAAAVLGTLEFQPDAVSVGGGGGKGGVESVDRRPSILACS